MSYNNGPTIITDGLYFLVDAMNKKSYSGTGTALGDLAGQGPMTITNAQFTGSYFNFQNPTTGSTTATQYIKQTAHNNQFITDLAGGCSAFVTFYNTSDLAPTVESWWRQCPMSFGYDSAKAGWHITRYRGAAGFLFSYKFDQEPTYGSTISFGAVNYNEWTQLGFTLDNVSLRLFKNGQYVTQLDTTGKSLSGSYTTDAVLGLGAMTNTGGNLYGFIGYVANAGFYTRKLKDTEMLNNYNALRRSL